MCLFDDLTRIKPLRGSECGKCSCDVAGKLAADREEEILHQFLCGIDDSKYAVVRTNLLSQQPPVDLSRAYQALLQEEESRGFVKGRVDREQVKDAHAFAVSAIRSKGISDRRDKSKLFCSHCKKTGHDNEGCFVLHGYPEWWYELKRKKEGTTGGNSARAKATASDGGSGKPAAVRANVVTGAASEGNPHGKRGWRLYDLETGEIFVSRDVNFYENEFSFACDKELNVDSGKNVVMENSNVGNEGVDFDFLDDLEAILEVSEASHDSQQGTTAATTTEPAAVGSTDRGSPAEGGDPAAGSEGGSGAEAADDNEGSSEGGSSLS
uniref:Retroviral polymerase SH3-like domain-containing protein n=1 Tax=Chenopodium quinoa TaxID=63459 RepID=A0A803L4L7_CHEQI